MANAPSAALGVVLKYYDASDANPVTLLGLVSLKPPGLSLGMTERTAHADTWRRRHATIPELGTMSGKVLFDSDDTTQSGLRTLLTTKARRKFAVVLSDTGAEDFSFFGYVTKFDVGEQTIDGTVEADFEITPDGEPTFA